MSNDNDNDNDDDDKQTRFPFMVDGVPPPRSRASMVTPEVKDIIFRMRSQGYIQSDIAAAIGTNQGRVSEVLRGLR